MAQDLIQHRMAPWLLWVFPVLSIILASVFDLSDLWTGGVWTIAMAIMGCGCGANVRRCGRVHCHITGPFFLVISGIALLHVIGVLDVSKVNWAIAGWTVGVLAAALTVITEIIFGKYVSKKQS